MTQFGPEYWEDRYLSQGPHQDHAPSPHLVAEVTGLPPGTALDAGCGEGVNAVWLAAQGWQVTAADVSAAALDRARRYADEQGLETASRVTFVHADLTAQRPPAAYALVTSFYVHPAGAFDDYLGVLLDAVAPCGTLLVVGHDADDEHTHADAPADASFDAERSASALDLHAWVVEAAETRPRTGPGGVTMRDAVLVARRR